MSLYEFGDDGSCCERAVASSKDQHIETLQELVRITKRLRAAEALCHKLDAMFDLRSDRWKDCHAEYNEWVRERDV